MLQLHVQQYLLATETVQKLVRPSGSRLLGKVFKQAYKNPSPTSRIDLLLAAPFRLDPNTGLALKLPNNPTTKDPLGEPPEGLRAGWTTAQEVALIKSMTQHLEEVPNTDPQTDPSTQPLGAESLAAQQIEPPAQPPPQRAGSLAAPLNAPPSQTIGAKSTPAPRMPGNLTPTDPDVIDEVWGQSIASPTIERGRYPQYH